MIVHGDEASYRQTPEFLRTAVNASYAELQNQGALIGMAKALVQVRNTEGRTMERCADHFYRRLVRHKLTSWGLR